MTLLELVNELNELVGNDLVMAQKEVDTHFSCIWFEDDTQITFDDDADYDNCYDDDVDESFYDPYLGQNCYEDCGFFDEF